MDEPVWTDIPNWSSLFGAFKENITPGPGLLQLCQDHKWQVDVFTEDIYKVRDPHPISLGANTSQTNLLLSPLPLFFSMKI